MTQTASALQLYRRTQRALGKNPLWRVLLAIPRTLRFVADNLERRLADLAEGEPAPPLSAGLAAHVAMDEAILALAMGPGRFPRRADYLRVSSELRQARALFEERGWLADPAGYHRAPPPLQHPSITPATTVVSARPHLLRFERLRYPSEFEPRPGEIGRERWLGHEQNRTAGAWLLRHRGGPRPWLVCLHGFGMGWPFMDFGAFPVRRLHHELGYNLALPVLPLHGARRASRSSGDSFLSFDLVSSVHGLTQAVWDVRRLLGWLRAQGEGPIAVHGVSLGAYVAALLGALEDGLAGVIAGIPVADFPALFRGHSPGHIRLRAIEHRILGGPAEDVHRVVSPLALPSRVPHERRFIFAGLGDRVARPGQAHRLWLHWDKPSILWYRGNHVGYLWSQEVTRFVLEAAQSTLGGARP